VLGGTLIAQATPMAPLTRKLPVLCLGSALQFFAVSAPAQEAATQPPSVSQNGNSAAREDEPTREGAPAGESESKVAVAPGVPVGAASASPVYVEPLKLYAFRVRSRTAERRIEVRSSHDEAIARCVGGCWLSLPSGDYKALFYDQSGAEHEFKFSVQGPGGIEIKDADPDTASTGLVFGILGTASVVAAVVLMGEGMQHACLMAECQNQDNSGSGLFLGGLAAFVAGAVMTPIGWVTWAHNRHPRLHDDPTAIKIAVVPNHDGAFLGLSGHF